MSEATPPGAAPPPPGGWRSEPNEPRPAEYPTEGPPTATAVAPPPPSDRPPAPPATGEQPPEWGRRRRPRGVTVGSVLVVLGALLLIANVLPGLGYGFGQLWPLIIVVLGGLQMVTPSRDWQPRINRVADGLVTMAIGGVFLANTTGFLPWTVWGSIISLWPVLIISIGLSILGRGVGQRWLGAVGSLLVLAALLYGALVLPARGATFFPFAFARGTQPFSQTVPAPAADAHTGTLQIQGGVGLIRIAAGSPFVSIQGTAPEGAVPTVSTADAGRTVTIASAENQVVFPGIEALDMSVDMTGKRLWTVAIDSGVSTLDADLSGVPVESLTLKTGVSTSRVKLGMGARAVVNRFPGFPDGTGAPSTALVKSGVADVQLQVPASIPVRVVVHAGLTNVQLPSGFTKQPDGSWMNEKARSGGLDARSWDMTVESGVGAVRITQY